MPPPRRRPGDQHGRGRRPTCTPSSPCWSGRPTWRPSCGTATSRSSPSTSTWMVPHCRRRCGPSRPAPTRRSPKTRTASTSSSLCPAATPAMRPRCPGRPCPAAPGPRRAAAARRQPPRGALPGRLAALAVHRPPACRAERHPEDHALGSGPRRTRPLQARRDAPAASQRVLVRRQHDPPVQPGRIWRRRLPEQRRLRRQRLRQQRWLWERRLPEWRRSVRAAGHRQRRPRRRELRQLRPPQRGTRLAQPGQPVPLPGWRRPVRRRRSVRRRRPVRWRRSVRRRRPVRGGGGQFGGGQNPFGGGGQFGGGRRKPLRRRPGGGQVRAGRFGQQGRPNCRTA